MRTHPTRRIRELFCSTAFVASTLLQVLASTAPAPAAEVRGEDQKLLGLIPHDSRRFGSRVAMSRSATSSAFAMVGGPHASSGAEFARYVVGGDGQWQYEGTLSYSGAQTLAIDLESGVAIFAEQLDDGTTRIISVLGNGDYDIVESGIEGPIGSIAVSWDFLAGVIAIGQPKFAFGAGRILIYEGIFGGEFSLVASDAGGAGDRLGESLAMCGSAIVAGMPREGDNGAAKIYLHTSEWTEWQQLDSPASSQSEAWFGAAVAISEDCRWVAVGSPNVDRTNLPEAPDIGAVYLYESDFLSWEYSTLLRPAGAASWDHFGASVAIHGETLVAGSPGRDETQNNQGAAYVYHLSGPVWKEHLRLVDSDPDEDDLLGTSVAIGGLGALVGAPLRDSGEILDCGAVNFYADVAGIFFDGFESADPSNWSASVP